MYRGEKSALSLFFQASSGRHLQDPFWQGTRKRITVLAENVSLHFLRSSACRLLRKVVSMGGDKIISESTHAVARSRDSSQRWLATLVPTWVELTSD